ncbi:MAG: GNAT family N-acetyltransferase [Alphaproteobacteria bacterium]|nr:GNAT family N-acetyltransferase [Alphaproteobacteria bacterium]
MRPLVPDDARHFADLLGADPAAIAMLSHMPDPLTVEAAREWIELRTGPGGHVFALRDASGTFVGTSGFGGPRDGIPGFGYWIGAAYRGNGYATEAGDAIVAHARRLGVKRMVAETFPGNAPSERVLVKLGFRAEGPVIRNYPLRGGWRQLTLHVLELRDLVA